MCITVGLNETAVNLLSFLSVFEETIGPGWKVYDRFIWI